MIVILLSLALVFSFTAVLDLTDRSVQSIELQSDQARIRAYMGLKISMLTTILRSPSNYQQSPTASRAGLEGLSLTPQAMSRINSLVGDIDPAICPPTEDGPCQLLVRQSPTFVMQEGDSTPRIVMSLEVVGAKPSLRLAEISIKPAVETLRDIYGQCKGIFMGFDAQGGILCEEVSYPRAPAGSFISAINTRTFEPTFSRLPPAVRCADGQYVSSYQWQGYQNVDFTCTDRLPLEQL